MRFHDEDMNEVNQFRVGVIGVVLLGDQFVERRHAPPVGRSGEAAEDQENGLGLQ